jgi:hypothetical protein
MRSRIASDERPASKRASSERSVSAPDGEKPSIGAAKAGIDAASTAIPALAPVRRFDRVIAALWKGW